MMKHDWQVNFKMMMEGVMMAIVMLGIGKHEHLQVVASAIMVSGMRAFQSATKLIVRNDDGMCSPVQPCKLLV